MFISKKGDFDSKNLKYRLAVLVIGVIVLIVFLMVDSFASDAGAKDEVNQNNNCYENKIAITFDDGPRAKTTEVLLDGLKERGVKATFFLVGKSVEKFPETVKRMSDEGHLIGSHTYSHVQLDKLSYDRALEEIEQSNKVIESITGASPSYIRPPYGMYSDELLMAVNMTSVLWTIDPNDWNTTNSEQVVKNVVSKAKCGDIILMHDIYPSSVAAALEIIDQLQAKGYVFVAVDQILLD